jgi:flagellar P-ring protein precursor FlgI
MRTIVAWVAFLLMTTFGAGQTPSGQGAAPAAAAKPSAAKAKAQAASTSSQREQEAVGGGIAAPFIAPGVVVGTPPNESLAKGVALARVDAGARDRGAISVALPVTEAPHLARIKDVSSIEGIRDNQLVGYGLVMGLAGTGDSQQTTFPTQTLASMLLRMGVSVPASSIRVQNLAAVFVSATLPPFARPGTKLDVTAASAGDAKSLDGGVLLMTPLYGADGKIYAQAQGSIVLGGYSVSSNGNSKQLNHPTTGRIPFGAITERGIALDLTGRDHFSLLLNDADFHGAEAMADAVNHDLGRPLARVIDSRRVELMVPPNEDIPLLLSKVEAVQVPQFPRAKVIINERTGTVVIGGTVVLQPVSILHGGLAINVVTEFRVSQPGPFSNGTTQVTPETRIDTKDKPVSHIELKQGSTVDDLVRSLQTIGANAHDVISILQAMKAAGALEAEIEVL